MTPIIDSVKAGALNLESDFRNAMTEKHKEISALRVRVIAFRDFFVDGSDAISASPFYSLPEDAGKFSAFVNAIHASGGGDEPESGLEALALAMRSDWDTGGDRRRHVIVVWTDASAHPLERAHEHDRPPEYPAGMPATFDELTDLWDGQEAAVNANAKRLVVFAPDAAGWNEIDHHWTQTVQAVSQAGRGLADHDYKTILSTIAESV